MNASIALADGAASGDVVKSSDNHVPISARPCHGVRVSILAEPAAGAAMAMSLAGFDVTRFIANAMGTS